MAASTIEEDNGHTPRALGALPNEADNNNPMDHHSRDTSPASESTIDRDILEDSEIIMWNVLVSPRCSPIVKNVLHKSYMFVHLQADDERRSQKHSSTTILRDQVIAMSMALAIPLDTFIPMRAATDDHHKYLWFTWLTEAQYNDFKDNGTVLGHKDTRGDS
eukprot:4128311-Amphidinium_carterae.1